jgi:hypothetical protein
VADPFPTLSPYLDGAEPAAQLLTAPEVAAGWATPSVLQQLTVGGLAGHLARAVLQVEWFLDLPAPDGRAIDAPQYYADLEGARDLDSALNVGVRERSDQVAATGPHQVAADTQATLARLRERLPREGPDRVLEALGRPITLDQYLRTRCVELAVHIEDLALSVHLEAPEVTSTAAVAVDVLVGAAERRHGPVGVLRSLTRRERDPEDAIRIL